MPTRFCSCYPRVQAVMLSGGATLLPYIGALDVGFTLLRELVDILVPARGSLAGLLCSPGRVMLSCGGEGTRVTLSPSLLERADVWSIAVSHHAIDNAQQQ